LTDRIFVDNLRVPCRVGLTPAERGEPQEIVVDVSIFLSLARAARGDEVKDSVNYRDVKERISAFATGRKFSLLETVAEGIAGALLDSIVGAGLQARQWCPACSCECETPQHYCGTPTTLRRGVRWIQNDAVNLMATLGGAIVAAALLLR